MMRFGIGRKLFFIFFIFAHPSNLLAQLDEIFISEFKKNLLALDQVQSITKSPDDITITELNIIPGSFSCGYYDVTIKDQILFAKRSNRTNHNEQERLKALNSFIKAYQEENNEGLPKFAQYFGDISFSIGAAHYNIILSQKAPGLDLGDFMCESLLTGFDDDDTKKHYLACFRRVGETLARFHLKYKTTNDKNFLTLIHGDLHFNNILYDDVSNLVTLVDFETMSLDPKNITKELAILLDFEGSFLYLEKRANILYKDQFLSTVTYSETARAISLESYKDKFSQCTNSLYQGYMSILEKAGLPPPFD